MLQFIKKRSAIKILISFILAFVILYFFISSAKIDKLYEILSKVNLVFILIALLIFYIMVLIKGLRWKILLSNIGFKEKLSSITEIYFLGQFANTLLPARTGDFYRAHLMKTNFGIARTNALGTIFVERLFDVIFMLILLFLSAIAVFGRNIPKVTKELIVALIILVVIVLILFLVIKKQKKLLLKILPKKLKYIIHNFESSASTSLNFKTIPQIFLLTLTLWALELSIFYFISVAIGLKLTVFLMLFIILMSNTLMMIPITPSGLGFVEMGIASVLFFVGIERNIAVSVALLYSTVGYWNQLVFGFIAYIFSKRS